ncbi:DNA polymerase III subunit delta' [Baaleninema simplex]|uniref:DNA polymerase III subunit delta' n=1 Tax=Baaleninema simplex TaxID=2862350 RepID=UPI00034CDC01|nr:DNA polymerase III subunit delta' [Baaleninema simplex]
MSPRQIPIGQETALKFLHAAIDCDRIAPAYLFAGPEGIGRAIAARYFAGLLLGGHRDNLDNHPDFLWVEPTYLHNQKLLTPAEAEEKGLKRKAPPQIRLEQIREIGTFLSRPPLEASRKVIILDRAETMAEPAANGLLKTLEEPGRATLILIAPSAESLLSTLVSRCQRIPFYRLPPKHMEQVLRETGHEEILGYRAILAVAQGSPGAAIESWQRLQTIPPEILQRARHLPRTLRDALDFAKAIASTLDTTEQLWLLDYLQQSYWHDYCDEGGTLPPLQKLEAARSYLRSYVQPRLVWEVTLMELACSYP